MTSSKSFKFGLKLVTFHKFNILLDHVSDFIEPKRDLLCAQCTQCKQYKIKYVISRTNTFGITRAES